jgi:hypothetical protein
MNVHACPVCGQETDYMGSAAPDPDWEHEVELRTHHRPSVEQQKIERWRLQTALDFGYDVETANSLAVSDADLHDLDALIRKGCPLLLAARIV